jgi:hypothetical protein
MTGLFTAVSLSNKHLSEDSDDTECADRNFSDYSPRVTVDRTIPPELFTLVPTNAVLLTSYGR